MNLLQVIDVSKQMGPKKLFEKISLSVNADEHIGVIGPNGAGKTTLFKIIAGLIEMDEGHIVRSKALRLGYLQQESDWNLETTVEEFILQNAQKPVWEIKRWTPKLGLTEAIYSRPLKELSGGYRMRVQLLKLLAQDPNLLLLDEPTNFLDLETTLVLEQFLQGYQGAFMMISHDREFLRRTTDHIVEIETGDVTKFPGNIDDYFEQKEELRLQQEAQAKNLEAKRAHLMSFVERFRAKATKAKQAQSRLKQVQKMEMIELKELPVRAAIRIPEPIHTGKETLHLQDLSIGYEGRVVLSGLNFRLLRGDHLGVVGVNGAGKSTLLKTLSGRLKALYGGVSWGYNVKCSAFSQHSMEDLLPEETVLQALQRKAHPDLLLQEIKNMAGSLLFSGDDIEKKIKVLSGGEKSRVALGQVLLEKNPVLLLDEPTNHLDFETVEALTQALQKYTGTLLVVSHDRGFVRRVASRILEVSNGRAEFYPGSYDDYVWRQQQLVLEQEPEATSVKKEEKLSDEKISANQLGYLETKKLNSDLRKFQKLEVDLLKKVESLEKQKLEKTEHAGQVMGAEAALLFKDLAQIESDIQTCEEQVLDVLQQIEEIGLKLKRD